jgi:hypothetical protein
MILRLPGTAERENGPIAEKKPRGTACGTCATSLIFTFTLF